MAEKSDISTKERWVNAGYQLFGQIGTAALNVERLSMILGLSRSSFYHHFGEIEIFENHLLKHHIDRYETLKTHVDNCNSFDPELLALVTNFKDEVAFQRQLLINETIPRYQQCFNDAKAITEDKIYKLWSNNNKVQANSPERYSLFLTIRDFFLVHYNQSDEQEIRKILKDVQTLLHGHQIE